MKGNRVGRVDSCRECIGTYISVLQVGGYIGKNYLHVKAFD
jgi:hypothetical protein